MSRLLSIVIAPNTVALITVALVNLSVPGLCENENERSYWKIALSSTIGYLFPNPTLAAKSSS